VIVELDVVHGDAAFVAHCELVRAEGGTITPYIPAHLEVVRVLDAAGRAIAFDDDPLLWEEADRVAARQ
jgi:hypothetical protein